MGKLLIHALCFCIAVTLVCTSILTYDISGLHLHHLDFIDFVNGVALKT